MQVTFQSSSDRPPTSAFEVVAAHGQTIELGEV
jgi:hypothetical protein